MPRKNWDDNPRGLVPKASSRAVLSLMGSREAAPNNGCNPKAAAAEEQAGQAIWTAALVDYRDRLRRMVAVRLDERLLGRVDPSDVIQEAYLEAAKRMSEYTREPSPMPFFLWVRFLTLQQLQLAHRKHLGVHARDAAREVSIHGGAVPEASSAALAAQLLGRDTRASEAAILAERKLRLQTALEKMDPVDREVLALRNFERLSNGETARVLGLSDSAATKRYVRALRRLKDVLASFPGGLSELGP
jgi:RNA polymerase sigma-70 factor (ECF subfamily)